LDTGIYMERKYQKYLLIKNKSPEFYFGASLWSQFS